MVYLSRIGYYGHYGTTNLANNTTPQSVVTISLTQETVIAVFLIIARC